MNIKQAIKRVEYLKDLLREVDRCAAENVAARTSAPTIYARMWITDTHEARLEITTNKLSELAEQLKDAYQKEIDALQPVIDMANAALKGILNEGQK